MFIRYTLLIERMYGVERSLNGEIAMKSIEELNEAVRNHKRNNQLNKTEIAVLDLLAQYSCKEVGRSYMSKSTIAEKVGKSRRTIIRVCNRLETLGIIRQSKRMRLTGDRRQTSNLIEICDVAQNVPRRTIPNDDTPECHTEETPSRISNNNTYKETASALKRSIPSPIFDALAPYFSADELYKTYGILLRAKASIDRNITLEDYSERFIEGFKAVIYSYKRGRVKNLSGCLFAAWRQVATEIKRKMTLNSGGVYYDWISEKC